MSLDFTFKTQFEINLQISAEDTVVWLRTAGLEEKTLEYFVAEDSERRLSLCPGDGRVLKKEGA